MRGLRPDKERCLTVISRVTVCDLPLRTGEGNPEPLGTTSGLLNIFEEDGEEANGVSAGTLRASDLSLFRLATLAKELAVGARRRELVVELTRLGSRVPRTPRLETLDDVAEVVAVRETLEETAIELLRVDVVPVADDRTLLLLVGAANEGSGDRDREECIAVATEPREFIVPTLETSLLRGEVPESVAENFL